MSVADFNAQVFALIDKLMANNKTSGVDELCNLSGTIFPGDISFRAYGSDNPLPPISFSGATFSGKAEFEGVTFSGRTVFNKTTFSGDTSFRKATFNIEADFGKANFCNWVDFALATFSNNADFRRTEFNGSVYFERTKFGGEADFRLATFVLRADFNHTIFVSMADFEQATFTKKADFNTSDFGREALFMNATFGGEADFGWTKAKVNALRLHSLDRGTLAHLSFTSMETECFSFKGCNWPDGGLWPETQKKPNYKTCEELYRSLKQKAAGEHDQPLVSKWHYREKLMGLKRLIEGIPQAMPLLDEIEEKTTPAWRKVQAAAQLLRLAPGLLLSLNFWYWAISGYGEREKRASVWLAILAVLPFVLNAIPSPIESFPFSAQVNDALSHFPFAKDIPGQGGWLRLGKGISQLLIALQASLFAFALRNRFRR